MHWFSILNSMMVVVVMSCIVAMIMMRTIRKDLAQYESLIVDSGGASNLRTLQLCCYSYYSYHCCVRSQPPLTVQMLVVPLLPCSPSAVTP